MLSRLNSLLTSHLLDFEIMLASWHMENANNNLSRDTSFAYAKTKGQISCAVTAQLISTFVFVTQIVQTLCFLNPKFQASSHLLCLYSSVCVRPGRKPQDRFARVVGHLCVLYHPTPPRILNPYLTNGYSHHYHLDEPTFIFRGVGSDF